ncbi:hypothetical protein BLOT_009489 [Blomia tropicalis]|nr:hypothetical protein BLOT_009489 [Blomia tropicalis]
MEHEIAINQYFPCFSILCSEYLLEKLSICRQISICPDFGCGSVTIQQSPINDGYNNNHVDDVRHRIKMIIIVADMPTLMFSLLSPIGDHESRHHPQQQQQQL